MNVNSARGGRGGRGRGYGRGRDDRDRGYGQGRGSRGGVTDYSGRGGRSRSRGGRYRLSNRSSGQNIYWSNSRFTSNMFYDPEPNKYSFYFEKGYLVDDYRHYKDWNYKHFKEAYIEYYSSTKPSSSSKGRFYLASQARRNSKSPKSLYICLYKRYTIA
jgi:hypothetical protein